MPYTVWGAFDKFRSDTVDLSLADTSVARSSRDFLLNQLELIEKNDVLFPKMQGKYIPFGSFARSTKIQPLDDIDLLIPLMGGGTRVVPSALNPDIYWLELTSSTAHLARFLNNYGYINSTKILNKIRDSLVKIKHYQKAEIRKTMQAVTLNLVSYDWVFDIVPAVPVGTTDKTDYYLIPDGYGNWIRTDPRIDRSNASKVNKQHINKFLPTLRLLKYWNNRTHKPILKSYYFETLAIKVFDSATTLISDYPSAIKYFFDVCPSYLHASCPDPKNLGQPLDINIDYTTKHKISVALYEAASFAAYALDLEKSSKHEEAIYWWGRVFGSKFPNYG